MLRLGLWVVLLAIGSGCASAPPVAPLGLPLGSPFELAVERHLDAIAGRDLEELLATTTESDDLTVIFPSGTRIEGRDAFAASQAEFFADPSWTMTFERLSTVVSPTMGIALVRWTMADDTPRSGRQALLALTFRLEDGEWRMVHDQNTPLPPPAFDLDAARVQIEALNRRFGEGFRTGNAGRIASLYAADARFLEPGAAERVGRAAIADYWRENLTFISDMTLTTVSLTGTADVLYETGTVDTVGPTPDGAGYVQRDKYVNVWRLQPDGSYRIVIDMWNSRPE